MAATNIPATACDGLFKYKKDKMAPTGIAAPAMNDIGSGNLPRSGGE